MTERKKRRGRFPLMLGLILLAAGLIGAHGEDDLIQYTVRAPGVQAVSQQDERKEYPNDPLTEMTDKLDTAWQALEGSITDRAVEAGASAVSLSSDKGNTVEAALHAVDGDYFALYPNLLLYGRLLYPEEIERGDRVIVLDEDLAIKLFMISDPTGRSVKLAGEEYRVIGVVRHTRSVGEADLFGAYVPLQQIRKENIEMDMLTVTVRPVPQSGALAAFTSAMENWERGGSTYDLSKEAMRAGMLSRLVLCAAALYLILAALRKLNGLTGDRFSEFRNRLRLEYARVLLPAFVWDSALLLIGYAALIGGLAGLTLLALQPVYTFPEWIPAVLVEWEDIKAAFWNLATEAARPVKCLTPEMIRIEFWARIARWGLIWALFGGCVWRRRRA